MTGPDYQRVAAVLVRIGLRMTSRQAAATVPDGADRMSLDIDGDPRPPLDDTVLPFGATGEAGQPRP